MSVNYFSCSEMEFIDVQGTSQENIAKEVVEVAKRRGLQLNFQVQFNIYL